MCKQFKCIWYQLSNYIVNAHRQSKHEWILTYQQSEQRLTESHNQKTHTQLQSNIMWAVPCRKPDHVKLGKSQRRCGLSGFDEIPMTKRPQTTQYITLQQIGFHDCELSLT